MWIARSPVSTITSVVTPVTSVTLVMLVIVHDNYVAARSVVTGFVVYVLVLSAVVHVLVRVDPGWEKSRQ